jgi:ASPM-SPD-2-Hydin domain-containing protein/putative pyrroloquinoline-quinone binding quinoprotein/HYDIN/CFA65/VesB family protein
MHWISGKTVLRAAGRILRPHAAGASVAAVALGLALLSAGSAAAAAGSGRAGRPAGTLTAPHAAPADDDTASLNNLRTGWDPSEPGLSPSVVHGSSFGEVFSTAVNGQVYAQPLVIGSTVIVATEKDWVYALNASTGAIKWSTSLGTPYRIPNCTDLVPDIGVTSAPVYDPSTGTVYAMAQVVNNGKYVAWRLYGLSVATGAITFQRGIYGSPSNDPNITINTRDQDQRAGLLLLNGWVYASFASHCDHKPWTGYVAGIDLADKAKSTLWTDESGVTYNQAGIWQAGGGLMSDGSGRIIVASGNGVSPAPGPGSAPPGQLAESVIRLAPRSNGTLAAKDFFSPANAPTLDAGDLDYGSAGPVGLPVGTTAYPHILVQGGKIGRLFLLNRNDLGGRKQGPGGTDDDLYQSQAYGGMWGHPAVFEASTSPLPPGSSGLSDYVYSVGRDDYLRAFRLGTNSSGRPALTDAANSTFTFGFSSGSPVVTSNGTNPSSAVVWVVHVSDRTGTGADLVAFDAVPQPAKGGGVKLQQINSEPIGTASKFTIAAPSNGMIYVGTRDGRVLGFGVTAAAALRRGPAPAFGTTAVGSATTRTATATAARTVTVTGIRSSAVTSPDPFTIGKVTETSPGRPRPGPVTFPVTLHRGDTLRAPVTFAPAAPGGTSGTLSFRTAAPGVPANIPLIAAATRTGLYATAPSLSLLLSLKDGTEVGPVPVGQPVYAVTTIVNGGATAQRITKVSAPGGPFTARFLPRPGTILRPGQSVTVQIAYRPGRAVSSAGALTITGSSGPPVTVALSGTAQPAHSKFTAPPRISFGDIPVGHTATRFIHVVNAGNEAATVATTSLTGSFRAPYPVDKGLPVNGGYDLKIPVTFTPASAGRSAGRYTFTWKDRAGLHTLAVPVTATGVR